MPKSLLELAKTIVPTKSAPNWLDKLPTDTQASVKELADAYLSGELKGDWDVRELYVRLIEPNGIRVSETTFRRWIREYEAKKPPRTSPESPTGKRKAGS